MTESELEIKTSPGMSWFSARPDGTYLHRSFVLGGGGSSVTTADRVAELLASHYYDVPQDIIRELEDRGWEDVLSRYWAILAWREQEKRLKRIDELRKDIAYAEPLYKQGLHKDPGYWVKLIMDDIVARPDYDPGDVSLRRVHQSAQSAMGMVRRLPEMKEELARLLEETSTTSHQ